MATIKANSTVEFDGEKMRVVGHQGFDEVVLRSKDGRVSTVPVVELLEEARRSPKAVQKIDPIRQGKVAAFKDALEPVIAAKSRTRAAVEKAGEAIGISTASAYRALARYDQTGDHNQLPPPTRPGGRNKSRLVVGAEKIIGDTLSEILLSRRQHRIPKFMEAVKARLTKAGFAVSDTTLHRRIDAIPDSVWVGKRQGHKAAKRLEAHRGEAPTGDAPLDIVQVDHWKTDVEILSEDRLTVIGRAWLTLAIDVHTRVVWGWHLGLDHPGTVPTAFCMISGMTRKDHALRAMGLATSLPFWGRPKVLHLDNAGEFRGRTLAAACQHFDITLKFRPVESPQFGAHIERLNGTLAAKFKDLPGATGSSPKERKALRPELNAALTFDDLVKQIVMMFDEYHHTPHSGIGNVTPLEKWTGHFFHKDGRPKRNLPPIEVDDLEMRLHWYPRVAPTIQAYGIRVEFLDYYNEDIEQLIRNRKDYGRVEIRRNPLDVREIFLLHPDRKEWIIVPCRDFHFPVATIKELQEARRDAKRLGRQPTPANLAVIVADRQAHLEEAQKKTKSAARQAATAANNRKLRHAAPKVFGKPAPAPEPFEEHHTNVDAVPERPLSGRMLAALADRTKVVAGAGTKMAPVDEDFAGSAAALAGISDDDIDRLLDGH